VRVTQEQETRSHLKRGGLQVVTPGCSPSIRMISEIMEERMFPLTVKGLEEGMRTLR
jgi:hypothetical protein